MILGAEREVTREPLRRALPRDLPEIGPDALLHLLGRVRRAVDRRFDRARYDGERTATIFAARLRDETDVEAIMRDLATTTRSVVAPTSLSLWLRPRDVMR